MSIDEIFGINNVEKDSPDTPDQETSYGAGI
jgi:hypothetical protein